MNHQSDNSGDDIVTGNIDMSPEAIDGRLNMVSALYDLGKYLQSARPVDDDAGDRRGTDSPVAPNA